MITEKHKLMTSSEAAEYLGLSISYFRKLMMLRAIPMYKPGGKICFFKKEDLDAYIMSSRIPSQAEVDEAAATYTMQKMRCKA